MTRYVVSALLLLFTLITPAMAQAPQRIAAVVNDDLISLFDLSNRMNLVAMETNASKDRGSVERLARTVLQKLIDEKLMLQEAERLNIQVTQGAIDRVIRTIEQNNNMPEGGLTTELRRNGVLIETLQDRVRAEIAWNNIRNRIRGTLDISQREVSEEIARLEEMANKPQWLLGEIFLPVTDPKQEDEVRENVRRLRTIALANKNFPQLAKQFSKAASAAIGGDTGWVAQGTLPVEIEDTLANMKPGELSQPIRTVAGYHLIALRSQRMGSVSDPSKIGRDMAMLLLPLRKNAAQSEREQQAKLITDIISAAENCDAFLDFARQAEPVHSGLIPKLLLSDLPNNIASAVSTLKINQAIGPIPIEQGLLALKLCAVHQESEIPEAAEIEQKLSEERVSAAAQRTLRDLRRAAFIDIRI